VFTYRGYCDTLWRLSCLTGVCRSSPKQKTRRGESHEVLIAASRSAAATVAVTVEVRLEEKLLYWNDGRTGRAVRVYDGLYVSNAATLYHPCIDTPQAAAHKVLDGLVVF